MKKKIAIIGGGVMASAYGAACRRIGYESHYFTMPDGKVAEDEPDYYHEVNIFDVQKIVDICREVGIDGVVATTELSVSITAQVADALGVAGNPVGVAKVITDKYRNRQCIRGLNHLHSPLYLEASDIDSIRNAGIPYPIILKPVNLGGKRGLSVVNSDDELEAAFLYATKSLKPGQKPVIIVEQFLDKGVECSVESISIGGRHFIIQITRKDSGGAPHCVELGHHQPADISPDEWQEVVAGVTEGLTAIGLTDGSCHTEIKIVNGSVYLIEFNARPGGGCISSKLVMLSTGFDYFAALAKAAAGELSDIDTSCLSKNYSGLYYVVKQTEYLKDIFDTCQNESWCVEKHFVTDNLTELTHNDLEHTNYFIYASGEGDPVKELIKS